MSDISQLIANLSAGDDGLAEESVRQLVEEKNEAIPRLLELRNSQDIDSRWWAYCALGQMREAEVNWFLPGLHNTSADVRECAAIALCHNPNPSAIPELISALDDEDRMVAALACQALAAIGKEAVPELLVVMENGTPAARIDAARALATIQDPRSIPAFMAALDSNSELVGFWAEQGLENLGTNMTYFKPG
jgi:HEAT repeat protein